MYLGRYSCLFTFLATLLVVECKPPALNTDDNVNSLRRHSFQHKLGRRQSHHGGRQDVRGLRSLWELQDLPDHTKYVAMARYLMHAADWSAIATISTVPEVAGYPFPNTVSFCDGPVSNSTGQPYFYLTPLDFTDRDLTKDNKCSMLVSLAETDYCRQNNMDAEDPRCSRITLSGEVVKVDNTTEEFAFASKAMKERHPRLVMPPNHHFFLCKLNIKMIALVDWFGGPKYINVEDYFKFDFNQFREDLTNKNDGNYRVVQL